MSLLYHTSRQVSRGFGKSLQTVHKLPRKTAFRHSFVANSTATSYRIIQNHHRKCGIMYNRELYIRYTQRTRLVWVRFLYCSLDLIAVSGVRFWCVPYSVKYLPPRGAYDMESCAPMTAQREKEKRKEKKQKKR